LSDKAAGIVRVLQQVSLQAVLAQVETDCYSVDPLLIPPNMEGLSSKGDDACLDELFW